MKPNIVFLDEYTLGGADLTRLHELGRYTGYSTTAPDEVADRCRDAEIVITNKVVMRRETLAATGATTDRSTARTSFSATTKATATTSYVSTANGTWPSTTWNTA